jgi:hypothetical protein
MAVKKQIVASFTAGELLEDLKNQEHHGQLTEFICGLAEVLDDDYEMRASSAKEFAEGLSESACRFLAEVVCAHHYRNQT